MTTGNTDDLRELLRRMSDGELTDLADANEIELTGEEERDELIDKLVEHGDLKGLVDQDAIDQAREHHGDA